MAAVSKFAAAVRSLADLIPGQRARVAAVSGPAASRNRLLEMGLTRGTVIELIRVAPLGDPIELELRGYRLSVRRAEAANVSIESA